MCGSRIWRILTGLTILGIHRHTHIEMRPNRDLSFLSQELEELESDMTRTMECILDPYAVKVVDEEYRIWQCVFNVFKVIPK